MSHTEGKLSHAYRQRHDGMYAEEIFDEHGKTVATVDWYSVKTEDGFATNRGENARRFVECWNALLPIPTKWLEQYNAGQVENIFTEYFRIQKERDELVGIIRRLNAVANGRSGSLVVEVNSVLAKYPEEE